MVTWEKSMNIVWNYSTSQVKTEQHQQEKRRGKSWDQETKEKNKTWKGKKRAMSRVKGRSSLSKPLSLPFQNILHHDIHHESAVSQFDFICLFLFWLFFHVILLSFPVYFFVSHALLPSFSWFLEQCTSFPRLNRFFIVSTSSLSLLRWCWRSRVNLTDELL